MESFLAVLESSVLGSAIRGAGVWSYGIINAGHILGIASLFGAILVLDLRLLGWRGDRPLADVASGTVPVAAAGVAVALLTGLALLATNAREYSENPFLPLKFAAIGAALVNIALLHASPSWRAARQDGPIAPRDRRRLAIGGGVSLSCWLTALLAGRMLGYW